MAKEKHKPKLTAYVAELIANLPRCKRCNQLVHSKVDRDKPSEYVEWKGEHWTKANPQFIWMFPQGEFPELCSHCESLMNPPKVGRES